jgi:hypothetical protein
MPSSESFARSTRTLLGRPVPTCSVTCSPRPSRVVVAGGAIAVRPAAVRTTTIVTITTTITMTIIITTTIITVATAARRDVARILVIARAASLR